VIRRRRRGAATAALSPVYLILGEGRRVKFEPTLLDFRETGCLTFILSSKLPYGYGLSVKPREDRIERWKDAARLVLLTGFFVVALPAVSFAAASQTDVDVSPEATPEIRQVKPHQAAAGDEVTVIIEGKNYSPGAYVSFSTPAVHVISTRRASATELEAKVAVGRKAESGTISLYVSNPASSVAEAPFIITGGAAPAVVPAAPTVQSPQPAAVEVTSVDPSRAGKGSQLDLKIRGKNFAKGAKVAFSNPGIRVLETQVAKDTELTVRIQIAADAAAGSSGLFVVNPDDNEAEAAFVVTDEAATTSPAASAPGTTAPAAPAPTPAGKPAEKGTAESLSFEVISLADVAGIFQKGNRPKGTLTLAAGKIRYEESGKEVFAIPAADVKEINANTILGVNTGTFHIILNSGQAHNFIAASLRPADSQSIIDALRKALK